MNKIGKIQLNETHETGYLAIKINELIDAHNKSIEEWSPKEGEKYYYISHWGEINETYCGNEFPDKYTKAKKNVFKDEKSAQEALEREMKQLGLK